MSRTKEVLLEKFLKNLSDQEYAEKMDLRIFSKYNGNYWLCITTLDELTKAYTLGIIRTIIYPTLKSMMINENKHIFVNENGGYHWGSFKDKPEYIFQKSYKFPKC